MLLTCQRRRHYNPPCCSRRSITTSLLEARHLAFLARHCAARVKDVEKPEGNEHRQGVEAVLEGFMLRDGTGETLGVLNNAEDDADLVEEGQLAHSLQR